MGKTVAVCQFGGEFVSNNDGSMSYTGGDAYAIPIVPNITFDDFKSEIAEMCSCDIGTLTIKYFLPSNRRTPITVSNDKGLQRMIDFHEDSATIDVFVLSGEIVTPKPLNVIEKRVSKIPGKPGRPPGKAKPAATDAIDLSALTSSNGQAMSITSKDGQRSLATSTDGMISDVGQEFSSIQDLRDALRRYAIAKGFVYTFLKNGGTRVTAKCKADGCPWRIHASRISISRKFRIKSITNEHTCSGGVGKDGHPQASKHWVASIIKEKLRYRPHITPREIVEDIYRDYGVNLKYQMAWRGKEMAQEQLQGSLAEAYRELPWYCERIRETNPGSLVTLETMEDSRFYRLFISFCASQHGFQNGCRPLVFLGGTSLKEKCRGTLLAAASVDADDCIFPIAFAIVEAETYDNWHWFLTELKFAVSTNRTITFISDRHNGLEDAVPQVFVDSYHGYSLHHLMEDFKQALSGQSQPVKDVVINEFKQAAYACQITEFNVCMDSIRNVSQRAAEWVLASKPEHWSNAFFRGSRYGHVSSNIAELLYGWILENHELSITQTIDTVRCNMMEMIYTRREASNAWSTILSPSMEQRLQVEIINSRSLSVVYSSGNLCEVRDDTLHIVNIETWDCTCQRWQIFGLPCIHAVAVFDRAGRNMYDYCSRYFTVECYRLTYSESIRPIPDVGKPMRGNSKPQIIVRPPDVQRPRRPPGRPKLQKPELQEPKKRQRLFHCSRCGEEGHLKRTCKAPEQLPV